ncbi:unnamed protein product [Peniophora sp. CBMAI 1063]|nr:unnamed protein product [Peniophora sp. CBMAI 1063]
MFKRVDKRRKRKEEEEELGIDEEMKEAMGFNDTDSDESASSEDEDDDGSENGSEAVEGDEEVGGEDDDEGSEEDEDDEGSEEEDASDEEPTISVGEALLKPVRAISNGDHSTCVFCPSAILKHEMMIRVHLDSKAHKRRIEKANDLAMSLSPDTDIRILLNQINARTVAASNPKVAAAEEVEVKAAGTKEGEQDLSKRALKRIKKQQQIAAKRTMVKEMKARKAAKKREAEAKEDGSDDGADDGHVDEAKAKDGSKTQVSNALKGKARTEKGAESKSGESRKRKRETETENAQDTSTKGRKAKVRKVEKHTAVSALDRKPSRGDENTLKAAKTEVKRKATGKARDAAETPAVAPASAVPNSVPEVKRRKAPAQESSESPVKVHKKAKVEATGKPEVKAVAKRHRAKA